MHKGGSTTGFTRFDAACVFLILKTKITVSFSVKTAKVCFIYWGFVKTIIFWFYSKFPNTFSSLSISKYLTFRIICLLSAVFNGNDSFSQFAIHQCSDLKHTQFFTCGGSFQLNCKLTSFYNVVCSQNEDYNQQVTSFKTPLSYFVEFVWRHEIISRFGRCKLNECVSDSSTQYPWTVGSYLMWNMI